MITSKLESFKNKKFDIKSSKIVGGAETYGPCRNTKDGGFYNYSGTADTARLTTNVNGYAPGTRGYDAC